MAIDFPASPTLNQTFSSGNVNYVWDGTKWTASVTGGISLDKIEKGNTKAEVVDTGTDGRFVVTTEGTERARVDSAGRMGLGETAPGTFDVRSAKLTITDASSDGIGVKGRMTDGLDRWYVGYDSNQYLELSQLRNNQLVFKTNNTERARLTNDGKLLVGTSSASNNIRLAQNIAAVSTQGYGGLSLNTYSNVNFDNCPIVDLNRSRGSTDGNMASVANGDALGRIHFRGSDGTNFINAAFIDCSVDGTPGTNDMPGRLVFSTTADGASSPTERMRITNGGIVLVGKTSTDNTSTGLATYNPTTSAFYLSLVNNATNSGDRVLLINRQNTDGDLIQFFQAETAEGSISVSGTTVSYNGGHLSRWSQLPNDEDPSPILKGTVMSNLDEMCEWGEEDNEQLNKTQVSDVEGDKNVAGLFVAPAPTEDGPLDFYLAMTGDMVIRIAAGTSVERGDLLMSAGDGTAKPQEDDIIRSKTIAKVTSTNVSCTYDDGSYCVPCVLMAC